MITVIDGEVFKVIDGPGPSEMGWLRCREGGWQTTDQEGNGRSG